MFFLKGLLIGVFIAAFINLIWTLQEVNYNLGTGLGIITVLTLLILAMKK